MNRNKYESPYLTKKGISDDFHSGNVNKEDFPNPKNRSFERSAGSEKNSSGVPRGIFSLVVCVLLVAVLIRKFTGNNTVPTFTSFLEFLTNIDTPTIPFLDVTRVSFPDWGVFNFLRDFFIFFVDLGNVILFLINGIWIVINYVLVLFRWLFV